MAPVAALAEAVSLPVARRVPAPCAVPAILPRLFLVPSLAPAAPAAPREARSTEGRIAALYRQHGPAVYRRCLRLLKHPEAARDATQEVFLRLVRDEPHLLDREDLVPWLYRVATNHCLNLRRDARHHGETALDDGMEPASERRDDVLDSIVVQRLLARFDAVTQVIAVAILVDELDHEDVAAALGLSRRTMARKLDRFLELARRHLVLSGDSAASRRE